MNELFSKPRIPNSPVKLVLVSGEYPFLADQLEKQGIEVITTEPDQRLPGPVRFHPDMQACLLNREYMFVLSGNVLKDKLSSWGISALETSAEPAGGYPGDVLCNAFALGGFLVGNPRYIDSEIRNTVKQIGLKELSVRQGYASCSAAIVNENSVITADKGIASALEGQGLDVLRIRPGFIKLPGYDTGLIGGCCGLLAPDTLGITGRLSSHPDGLKIREFLKACGISVFELSDGGLLDVGGIVPLKG